MSRFLACGALLISLAAATGLRAGAPCCAGCGCQPCTRKVCRLICETKEVSKPVYECKCEDFCIPGRSISCRAPCDCPGECCKDHTIYKPTCGCVRSRTVLVIKKETKKVPAYKCVVEEVCTHCGHCAHAVDYPAADDAQTALAMVKGVAVDQVIEGEMSPAAKRPAEPSVVQQTAATGPLGERLTARR